MPNQRAKALVLTWQVDAAPGLNNRPTSCLIPNALWAVTPLPVLSWDLNGPVAETVQNNT